MNVFRAPKLLLLLMATNAASAHDNKPYDKNGGHWDDGGFYHCHLSYCKQGPNRFEHRLQSLSLVDMDQYYLKEDWPYWQQINGCKTARTVVLEATSKAPVTWTNPRQCELREGQWVDEYTGEEFPRAAMMEVDHIISPRYANAANGYQWDLGKRAQFANDPINLVPVGRETARKKDGRGISSWQPRKEYQCEYARDWKAIAAKYDLKLYASDISEMNRILDGCGDRAKTVEEKK